MTTLASVEELEPLVAAATAGSADAFGRIVGATSGMVASIALAIVRDVDLSQEIAQDVFLTAWRDRDKLRNSASFLPWLRQMTRNRAHHMLRSRVRSRRWLVQLTGYDQEAESVPDVRDTAAERVLSAERREVLRDALAALPQQTREVLILYYREGQSAAHVASLLELSEDAVKKRLSRARASLRRTMLERLGDTLATTTPGDSFTMAVMVALPLSMPLAGSAAAAGGAKIATAAAKSSGVWPWIVACVAPIGPALAGITGGLLGVIVGGRGIRKGARDDRERRELRWFTAASVATVVLFGFGIQLAIYRPAWVSIVDYAAFNVVMLVLHLYWLPRIVARRRAAEMMEEPVSAAHKRRRDRVYTIVGLVGGLGMGWLGVLLGLLAAHKL
jgi:RNA polymerase sigma factor (sigma-70 family)